MPPIYLLSQRLFFKSVFLSLYFLFFFLNEVLGGWEGECGKELLNIFFPPIKIPSSLLIWIARYTKIFPFCLRRFIGPHIFGFSICLEVLTEKQYNLLLK